MRLICKLDLGLSFCESSKFNRQNHGSVSFDLGNEWTDKNCLNQLHKVFCSFWLGKLKEKDCLVAVDFC